MCSSKCPSASRRSTHRRYPNRLFNRHEHKLLFVATATQPARTQTLVRCYHHCHEAHGSTHRYSLFHQNYPIVTRHPWQSGNTEQAQLGYATREQNPKFTLRCNRQCVQQSRAALHISETRGARNAKTKSWNARLYRQAACASQIQQKHEQDKKNPAIKTS